MDLDSLFKNIVNKTKSVATATYTFFKAFGLDVNFGSGKTETLFHFGGPGSIKAKRGLYDLNYNVPFVVLGNHFFKPQKYLSSFYLSSP